MCSELPPPRSMAGAGLAAALDGPMLLPDTKKDDRAKKVGQHMRGASVRGYRLSLNLD